MLVLNPRSVTFDGEAWEDVSFVSIDRSARRLVEEWSDDGCYEVFVDVSEQRVGVRIGMSLAGEGVFTAPALGASGELELFTSGGSDAGRIRVTCEAVVTRVDHDVSLRGGAKRSVSLIAVSADGATDPVVVEEL